MKKIIAAGIAATLAIASMIGTSNSQISTFAEVENHVALEGLSEGATTANLDDESPVEKGKAMRENLNFGVGDVITLDPEIAITYANGNYAHVRQDEKMYVVDMDDENQRFRVFVPRLCIGEKNVLFLTYTGAEYGVKVENRSGYIVGDVFYDDSVDVFDLAMAKRGLLYNTWPNGIQKYMADINADDEVTVLDLVMLQRRVHGIK